MHLLRFAISDLQSVIEANRHAYIQCSSTASLPSVECGTMPQQRYRLVGQRSITCFAIVSRPSPPSDASATVRLQSCYTVIAAGSSPCICTYEINKDKNKTSIGTKAVSVAVSLYGAMKSLATSFLLPFSHE